MLQCAVVCCRRLWESSDDKDSVLFVCVLQCAAVCCSVLQCVAVCSSLLHVHYNVLQRVAACCNVFKRTLWKNYEDKHCVNFLLSVCFFVCAHARV